MVPLNVFYCDIFTGVTKAEAVTRCLSRKHVTCHGVTPSSHLIGRGWSRDMNTDLWLVWDNFTPGARFVNSRVCWWLAGSQIDVDLKSWNNGIVNIYDNASGVGSKKKSQTFATSSFWLLTFFSIFNINGRGDKSVNRGNKKRSAGDATLENPIPPGFVGLSVWNLLSWLNFFVT